MKKLILALILFAGAAASDDISVTSAVDKNSIDSGDRIALQVTVSGSSSPALKAPQMNDFNVYAGGQRTQSSFSFVNGKMTSSTSVIYDYTLNPKGPGKFTIPPFTVEAGGKTYKSAPIAVEVAKGVPPQTQQAARQDGGVQNAGGNDLFVRVDLNKNKVYVNEPVTMTFGFYNRVNLAGQPQYTPPDTTGFWKEDLPPQINSSRNGYNVVELKTALFPASPGQYTVGTASLVCAVPVRGQGDDFFGGFFGSTKNVRLDSKPVQVTVLPLPEEGKPADFSGTVGKFGISATVDKRDVKTNDAVTLTVGISGTGNVKSIAEPKLLLSDEFKKYETVSDLNINKDNYEVKGSKVFKTVLVPRKAGKLTISPVKYTYFDPADKKYRTISSDPITLNVAQGPKEDAGYANLPSMPQAEGIRVFDSDIRFIKPAGRYTYGRALLYRSPVYLIITLFPFFAWLSILGSRKLKSSREENAASFKASRAYSRALKSLKPLQTAAQKIKREEFLGRLEAVYSEYIGNKINRPAAGLSLGEIKEILSGKLKEAGLAESAVGVFEELHFQRYAPAGSENKDINALLCSVKELITKLEKAGL